MARAQGARSQMALAFESVYGTAPTSGFIKMPFASTSVGEAIPLLENELLGYGRDPLAPDRDVSSVDGDVMVPVDARAFGHWLKATFGASVTTGADPYTHVFTTGGWTLPSLSIEKAMPEVPYFAMASGLSVNEMSWDMQRSGHLTAKVGLIGQSEEVATTSGAGTPATVALQRFSQRHGSVTRAASALGNVISASVKYSNNLDRIETIRGDGYIGGLDPSMATLSGQIVVRFADQTLLNQATDGDAAAFSFGFTHPDGETLTVSIPRVYLPKPKLEISGPGGIQATFDWQAAQQVAGGPMGTFTLVNDVATY